MAKIFALVKFQILFLLAGVVTKNENNLTWTINDLPIKEGKDVMLVANAPCGSGDPKTNSVWTIENGDNKVLAINLRVPDKTKYNVTSIKDECRLTIKDFSSTNDANKNYSITSGFDKFSKLLDINEFNYIYLPTDYISIKGQAVMNIYYLEVYVNKSFPELECRLFFNNDTVDSYILYKKTGLYYSTVVQANLTIIPGTLYIECFVGTYSIAKEKVIFPEVAAIVNKDCDSCIAYHILVFLLSVIVVLMTLNHVSSKLKRKNVRNMDECEIVDIREITQEAARQKCDAVTCCLRSSNNVQQSGNPIVESQKLLTFEEAKKCHKRVPRKRYCTA